MAESRTGTRTKRKDAREQRRSLLTQPFEQLAEKAREAVPDGETSPIAKTVAAAATAAAAAGLAGAAKALLARHRDDGESQGGADREEPEAERDEEEPEADAEEEAEEPQADAEQSDADEDEDDEEPAADAEDEADEPQSERDDEDQEPERDEPEAEADDEREDGDDGSDGASRRDVSRIVAAAREGLQEMLGHDVESVSGFERSDDGWCVTLEVVEVRRIPDSTDVLSSYRVLLDDDRQLVRLDRTHRYRRSQVDGE